LRRGDAVWSWPRPELETAQTYRVLRGENGISPEMAVRLEKAFGGAADFWLRMQMSFDLAQVRSRAEKIKVKPLEPKVA